MSNEKEIKAAEKFIKEVQDTVGVYDEPEYQVLVQLVAELEKHLSTGDLGAVMMNGIAIKERVDEMLSSASKGYAVQLVAKELQSAIDEQRADNLKSAVSDIQKEA